MTPRDLEASASVAATTVFASNVLLLMASGYFAGPAEMNPVARMVARDRGTVYVFYPLLLWSSPEQRPSILPPLADRPCGCFVGVECYRGRDRGSPSANWHACTRAISGSRIAGSVRR
jgi:hypothetical protein